MKLGKLLKDSQGYYGFNISLWEHNGMLIFNGRVWDVRNILLNRRVVKWRPSFNEAGKIVVYLEEEND